MSPRGFEDPFESPQEKGLSKGRVLGGCSFYEDESTTGQPGQEETIHHPFRLWQHPWHQHMMVAWVQLQLNEWDGCRHLLKARENRAVDHRLLW